jgi:hypothetical protein
MPFRAVYKSAAVESLDDFFSGGPDELRALYEYVLAVLERNESLRDIKTQLENEGRLPSDAVPAPPGSPVATEDFDKITIRGYSEAIRLALGRDEPVPVETLWMIGAGDDFEMHICDGKRRVTVLMLIPAVRDWGSERASSRSWVVGIDGEPVQRSGPKAGATPPTAPAL